MKIGLFGALTILFILLKVFNIVAWSWWIVFLPLVLSFALWILAVVVVIVIAAIVDYYG